MSDASQSVSVFMTIQFSIVLFLAAALSRTTAFQIAVPIITTARAIEQSKTSRVTTTMTQYLFAKGGQSEPESESELPSQEIEIDEVYKRQEELVSGLAGEGDENDLYDEIVGKTAYLGDQDGWTENENDIIDKDEDETKSVTSQTKFRDSTAFSVVNFLSSFSYPFTNNSANADDSQNQAAGNDSNGLGLGDGYSDRQDGPYGTKIDDGIYSESTNEDEKSSVEWDVYIDHSKASKEKGAIATLDSFLALSPPNLVQIHPAILSKTKGKGPTVRCIQRPPPSKPSITNKKPIPPYAFEVNNVNDVDKVYLILTRRMNIPSISTNARSCLKWTYRGNAHLEQENLPAAIRAYDRALSPKHLHPPHEGIILLLRATAYLKRAFHHQVQLRSVVDELNQAVPDPASLGNLFQLARQHPTLANPLFGRFLTETKTMQTQFQQTKYWHGLYEYSLLHAAKDSLRATQLMPESAQAYLRAADSLAELRKLKESILYYEKAMEFDPSLEGRIRPVIERLMRSWDFLERAKAMGWSGDTLRLALDVAG